MAGNDDTVGCVVLTLAALAGGWWLYNNYEVKKITADEAAPALSPERPKGLIMLMTGKDGEVWHLDADSVRGPKTARQGWVKVDHSKDKTVNYRSDETLYQVDCETTAARRISEVRYNANGETVGEGKSRDPEKTDPEFFPPSSIGYQIVQRLCSPSSGP